VGRKEWNEIFAGSEEGDPNRNRGVWGSEETAPRKGEKIKGATQFSQEKQQHILGGNLGVLIEEGSRPGALSSTVHNTLTEKRPIRSGFPFRGREREPKKQNVRIRELTPWREKNTLQMRRKSSGLQRGHNKNEQPRKRGGPRDAWPSTVRKKKKAQEGVSLICKPTPGNAERGGKRVSV